MDSNMRQRDMIVRQRQLPVAWIALKMLKKKYEKTPWSKSQFIVDPPNTAQAFCVN